MHINGMTDKAIVAALSMDYGLPLEGWEKWEDELGYVLTDPTTGGYVAVWMDDCDPTTGQKTWAWNVMTSDDQKLLGKRGYPYGILALRDAITGFLAEFHHTAGRIAGTDLG
jgi:hypothetical protein